MDGAAATVQAYFDAVNSRDYQRAWELGGRNLGGSYASFKAGFDDTVRSTPHIGDVNGDTVTVTIDALQTDGAVRHFSGTYTVQQGTIAHADVRAKGGDPPTSDSAEPAEPSESGSSSPQEPTTGTTDLDCSDLTGPTHVGSSDPYRLDADDDGMGCG